MDTLIYNNDGNQCGRSRNLRGMLDRARTCGGVKKIEVVKIQFGKAMVTAYYKNGFKAVTDFASFGHAVDWARDKRDRRGTWFEGCDVTIRTDLP